MALDGEGCQAKIESEPRRRPFNQQGDTSDLVARMDKLQKLLSGAHHTLLATDAKFKRQSSPHTPAFAPQSFKTAR